MRLLQGPTGSYRAFLYKGSSDGKTRTPSVWLMPGDNRLSVRVSTVANPDLGKSCSCAVTYSFSQLHIFILFLLSRSGEHL